MSDLVKSQLHMVHDPFAGKTSQPKIPDGKINDSLGFQTQLVQEVRNATGGDTTMHALIYAGTNSGIIFANSASDNTGGYYIPGFTGSNVVDWSNINTASITNTNTIANGFVNNPDGYVNVRTVSHGARLSLMNPCEEDDGWWEAVRIARVNERDSYYLATTDGSTDPSTNGTLAPIRPILDGGGMRALSALTNLPSYSTGLLKDLHRVQFDLHGQKDFHDFRDMYVSLALKAGATEDMQSYTTVPNVRFASGSADADQCIEEWIDPAYDMIYLRLHCRSNTGTAPALGSRFHVNCTSNQEIHFKYNSREARFMTTSHSVGADAMSLHLKARRANEKAGRLIH